MSSVRFRFKAELNYSNVQFDGHYISVGELKRLIAEKRGLGVDAANELQLSEAGGSQRVYDNDAEQIVKNSSVLVKRVAAARRPNVIVSSTAAAAGSAPAAMAPSALGGSNLGHPAEDPSSQQHDEFGEDPLQGAQGQQHVDAEMQAFVKNAAMGVSLESQLAQQHAAGRGRGRGRLPGGRGTMGGRGQARECHRCGQVGHLMGECPTQGDPTYDKRLKAPSGIPGSLIARSADGSLYLPDGQLGELAANTSAFQKMAQLMGKAGGDMGTPPPELPPPSMQATGMAAGQGQAPPMQPVIKQEPQPIKQEVSQQQLHEQIRQLQQQQQQLLLMHEQRMQQKALVKQEAPPSPLPVQPPQQHKANGGTAQLFDDDDLHAGAQQAQPVKLALGMPDAAGKGRSASPSISRQPAASAGTRSQLAADGDGYRGYACKESELLAALPMLQHLIPRDMAIHQIIHAFGGGRPLASHEFRNLQDALAQSTRPAPSDGRRSRRSRSRSRSHSRRGRGGEGDGGSPSVHRHEREHGHQRAAARASPDGCREGRLEDARDRRAVGEGGNKDRWSPGGHKPPPSAASSDSYERPARPFKLPEENSRAVGRAAAAAEARRAPSDALHRRQDAAEEGHRQPQTSGRQSVDSDSPRGSREGSYDAATGAGSTFEGRPGGEAEAQRRSSKHKHKHKKDKHKHRDKDKDSGKHKEKERGREHKHRSKSKRGSKSRSRSPSHSRGRSRSLPGRNSIGQERRPSRDMDAAAYKDDGEGYPQGDGFADAYDKGHFYMDGGYEDDATDEQYERQAPVAAAGKRRSSKSGGRQEEKYEDAEWRRDDRLRRQRSGDAAGGSYRDRDDDGGGYRDRDGGGRGCDRGNDEEDRGRQRPLGRNGSGGGKQQWRDDEEAREGPQRAMGQSKRPRIEWEPPQSRAARGGAAEERGSGKARSGFAARLLGQTLDQAAAQQHGRDRKYADRDRDYDDRPRGGR